MSLAEVFTTVRLPVERKARCYKEGRPYHADPWWEGRTFIHQGVALIDDRSSGFRGCASIAFMWTAAVNTRADHAGLMIWLYHVVRYVSPSLPGYVSNEQITSEAYS